MLVRTRALLLGVTMPVGEFEVSFSSASACASSPRDLIDEHQSTPELTKRLASSPLFSQLADLRPYSAAVSESLPR